MDKQKLKTRSERAAYASSFSLEVTQKPVYCITTQTEYGSIKEASQITGELYSSIGACCRGEITKSFKLSYTWCFVSDKDNYTPKKFKNRRQVYCIETGTTYEHPKRAQEQTGIVAHSIAKCCKKEAIIAGGYHWCYLEDKDTYEAKKDEHNSRVYCLEQNRVYESAEQAARENGLKDGTPILMCCLNQRHSSAGMHWCYEDQIETTEWESKKTPKASRPQLKIAELLAQRGIRYTLNDRSIINKCELDIYLPSYNLAIEYNGNYWHTEDRVGQMYHSDKHDKCKANNIKLISIFSHQLGNTISEEKIISKIRSHIQQTRRIFARKTKVIELDTVTDFLNNNHLQNSVPSSVKIGLEYQGELVAVMTFGKPRFSKGFQWELLRFCSKLNTTVVGGASKMFKYFENKYKPTSMISYANRQWSEGNIYKKLGFIHKGTSKPSYAWAKSSRHISRYGAQKHKLPLLPRFDFNPEESEVQNMTRNGFIKIFDCGNEVFTKNY